MKGMKERHQKRLTGTMDPVTFFDNSAQIIDDPTWLDHLKEGGGHYYGNIASSFAGFDGPNGDGYIPSTAPPSNELDPVKYMGRSVIWDLQKRFMKMPEMSATEPWNNTTRLCSSG